MTASELSYRAVVPSDFEQLKQLHELFFPVRYNDSFYTDSCNSIGINGEPLFTVMVTSTKDIPAGEPPALVGFVLAQFMDPSLCGEEDMFNSYFYSSPSTVLYILTIGVLEQHRGHGLGTNLLRMVHEHALSDPRCGCVSTGLDYSVSCDCCSDVRRLTCICPLLSAIHPHRFTCT